MSGAGRRDPAQSCPSIAIDVGQSGTLAEVVGGETDGITATGPPVSSAVASEAVLEELISNLQVLLETLGGGDEVGIGLSGLAAGPDEAFGGAALATSLRRALGVSRVVLASDVVTGYLGTLGQRAGVVLTWGTGCVALAGDGAHSWRRVDGRGPILGDLGGGYWIGRQGLVSALDHIEGRGGSARLAEHAQELYGDPDTIYRDTYRPGRSTAFVARFARSVSEAAIGGDQHALEIVDAAVGHIERTIRSAVQGLPEHDVAVALTGGLTRIPYLLNTAERRLAIPGLVLQVSDHTAPIRGARQLLATDVSATFPGLVFESRSHDTTQERQPLR